jgi:hypothetical protein
MSSEADGGRIPLSHSRQVTIDTLVEHFANDAMDVDEFERRVDLAHGAATTDALKDLVRDLPGGGDLPAVAGQGAAVPAPILDYTVTSAANVSGGASKSSFRQECMSKTMA